MGMKGGEQGWLIQIWATMNAFIWYHCKIIYHTEPVRYPTEGMPSTLTRIPLHYISRSDYHYEGWHFVQLKTQLILQTMASITYLAPYLPCPKDTVPTPATVPLDSPTATASKVLQLTCYSPIEAATSRSPPDGGDVDGCNWRYCLLAMAWYALSP